MKKIQNDLDVLNNQLARLSKEDLSLSIGIGSTRGDHWLPYIIADFLQKHQITLELHEQGEESLEKV